MRLVSAIIAMGLGLTGCAAAKQSPNARAVRLAVHAWLDKHPDFMRQTGDQIPAVGISSNHAEASVVSMPPGPLRGVMRLERVNGVWTVRSAHTERRITARGVTSTQLLGTWLTSPIGADNVYCTFRSDFSYTISHAENPWRHGRWKLSDDGTRLAMIDDNSQNSDIASIKRVDGRLLHVTISKGVQGSWKKIPRVRHSKPWIPHRPKQALERTADRREDLLSMISILKPAAQLAVVSGRSSCSR
jgi:hypothetical protein